ncbi:MAG TPA: hypothetical protein VGB57_13215 [Allosphingosinicella sp.]
MLEVETFGREELLDALRETRLRGFDGARVYADATLELVESDPAELTPAQRYVLREGVEKILGLQAALLERGIDVFALEGGLWVRTADSPEERIPVIPPIVEESREPDGRTVWIVNDGLHRVFAARSLGCSINTVRVAGVPPEYPYYALALPGGWAEVAELDELPDGFQKKEYRQPDNYKALFRKFNDVFPGVQKERKNSNPGFLQA